MEDYFGDRLIFKVQKKIDPDVPLSFVYEVLDVCTDPFLVEYFIKHYQRDLICHVSFFFIK